MKSLGLMGITYNEKIYENKNSLIENLLKNNQKLSFLNIANNYIDETGYIELLSTINDFPNVIETLILDTP